MKGILGYAVYLPYYRLERKAIGLGAAPWKIALVTRAVASGKSELTPPYAKPNSKPTIKRTLYGLT